MPQAEFGSLLCDVPKHRTMIGRPGQGVVVHPEDDSTMKYFGLFLLVTLVRGMLFLVPIVLVAVLAREGYQVLRRIAQPVARLLPHDRMFGILAEDLLSIIAIVLVFLVAGLFVGTRPGRMLSDQLERAVLYRVPGYLLVRGAVGNFPGLSRTRGRNPHSWRRTTAGPLPC